MIKFSQPCLWEHFYGTELDNLYLFKIKIKYYKQITQYFLRIKEKTWALVKKLFEKIKQVDIKSLIKCNLSYDILTYVDENFLD